MPITCPKCGTVNPNERHTCQLCGAELVLTARPSRRQDIDTLRDTFGGDLFGPPNELKGRFTVGRAVSQGDKVNLYRATDRQTGQSCLVHQASLTMLDMDMREVLEQRFLQEAARWQARRHPNILPILDADVQNHRLYLITAPVRGQSLRALIRDRSYLVPEHTLLSWAEQLCNALEYLHGQNPPVILGCLAPAAIHVDETGQVQIIEVGLIRHEQSGLFGTAKGTPGYAAPEQRQDQVTVQSDLYALGIILYQIITRFDPKERPLPPLNKYGEGYTAAVLDAIAVAYRREPEKRYPSAAEMREALLGASPAHKVRLPPLKLFEEQMVRTIPELAQTCAAHWDEGLLALLSGRIGDWLAEAETTLHEQGQDAEAVQARQALERTQRAYDEMTRPARPGQEEVTHNAALQSWLQDLGAAGIQPRLEVKPVRFDFGIVAPTVRARSAIQIRNAGRGYLTGRVESRVPWISIPQPVWGCPAQESIEVRVEVSGRNLPPGDIQSQQALGVWSNGGEAWIAAQASSSPPVLDVQPRTLNYGPITRGAARVVHLVLSNKGGGRLSGRISTQAPWLRIRNTEFSCPAGASAHIPVELLSGQLPTGAVRIRRALTIDSDSGQASVDVAWQWARPALELDLLGLDFESARRGEQIRRTLTLSNSGTADLTGTVQSRVPWLQVQPSEFTCAPGSTQKIDVLCNTSNLAGGSTVETEALVIAAN
ncbi:MAG: protein kinase, partial [Anaerolineae bacterium]|nr:protein kinase [Anaerolineae bacterium]